jgi:hypothetical protein
MMPENFELSKAKSIDYFRSTFPETIQAQLNYSPESLDTIEDWIIERYPNEDEATTEPDDELMAGLVYYIGETFRKHIGGYWKENLPEDGLDERLFAYHTLEGFLNDEVLEPPYVEVLTIAHDQMRDASSFKTFLLNLIERIDR